MSFWKQNEIAQLLQMREQSVPVTEIAQRLGRSVPSVNWQIRRSDMVRRPKRIWKPEAERRLREMWLDNVPIPDMAIRLGRTKRAVTKRAAEIGLPRRRQNWTTAEVADLRSALYRVIAEHSMRHKRGRMSTRSQAMHLLCEYKNIENIVEVA